MYDKGLFAKLSSSPILAQAHLGWAEIRCIISKYSSALICNLFFLTIFRDVKKSYTAQQTVSTHFDCIPLIVQLYVNCMLIFATVHLFVNQFGLLYVMFQPLEYIWKTADSL